MNMLSRSQYCRMQRRAEKRERGSLLVQFAVMLSVLAAILGVVDIGYMYYAKRDLQRIADLAALEAASAIGVSANDPQEDQDACVDAGSNAIESNWPAALEALERDVKCGHWVEQPGVKYVTPSGALNAAHVVLKAESLRLFPGTWSRAVSAEATARAQGRVARLSIRSTLASVDATKSPLLNLLVGGLLGGDLKLSVASWNGLLGARVDLLDFLDLVALKIGVAVGDYDTLLDTDVSVGTLLDVMLEAIDREGPLADVAIQALNEVVQAGAKADQLSMRLGQLLQIQGGLNRAGLTAYVNPLELLQATLQVANANHAVQLDLDTKTLSSVAGLAVRLRIIEPPKLSAIGDPHLVDPEDPLGTSAIYVRTAQVRMLVSLDIPVLTSLVNGIFDLLRWLLDLKLNLLPNARLDLSLEAGGGSAYVTGYSCATNEKMLQTTLRTSVADLRIGRMGATAAEAAANVLASSAPITNASIPLLTFGCQHCPLGVIGPRPQYYGGVGIKLNLPVAAREESPFFYNNPPPLEKEPLWQSIAMQNVIASLKGTLAGAGGLLVSLPAEQKNPIQSILDLLTSILAQLTQGLGDMVSGLLSPLLDPIINTVFQLLGVDIAKTEAGAQLNCDGRAELVY